MTTSSEEQPNADVEPGDVAQDPTTPEDHGEAHTAEDAEGDPPLDADEGDPDLDSYPG